MSKNQKKTGTILIGLRVVLLASLALFLVATLTEVYRAPTSHEIVPVPTDRSAEDLLIVPGTRIGPVTLGLSMKQVSQKLGKSTMRPHGDGVMHLYQSSGLVIYEKDGRVNSVTVRSPQFATRHGVRVGSDVDEVLSSLHKGYEMVGDEREYVLHNWEHGWHVGVKDNLVTYFQVSPTLSEHPKDF